MRSVFVFLFLMSMAGLLASFWLYGLAPHGQALLFGLGAAVTGLLALFGRARQPRNYIVVDGSNVMHWNKNVPALGSVGRVMSELATQGYTPVVWFDANVGYKIGTRYMGPDVLARQLGVSGNQVYVAPKGTPADPLLLDGAKKLGAKVVTNDRFCDWTDSHPQILTPGFLIRGQIDRGEVVLRDLGAV